MAPVDSANGGGDWLQPGGKAILCNLAKFPRFNGQVVELASWNEEKQRWKCLLPNGGDVNAFLSNLEPLEMPEEKVKASRAMLEAGQVFEGWWAIQKNRSRVPQELKAFLQAKLKGPYAEFVGEQLKLVPIPEKGMGYRAARSIAQGEVLLFEASLCYAKLLAGGEPDGPNMSREDPYYEMSKQVNRYQVGESFMEDKVMCLPYIKVADDRRSPFLRILENNSLFCTREPDYVAFFAHAARFNHSCCPNAFADTSRSECVVRALRDINEGEEVCISYVPVSEPLAKRQDVLSTGGFTCMCKRCEAEAGCNETVMVPCMCGKFSFSMADATRLYQTCEECYNSFDREESNHNLSKVSEANRLVRSGRGDPWEHLKTLTALEGVVKLGARNGVPPAHSEVMKLLSNLAQVNYHLATRVKGDHVAKTLAAFHRYQQLIIQRFEEKHGEWSRQRDTAYLQVLYMSLVTQGLDPKSRDIYAKKLADSCKLCFGQSYLPDQLSKIAR